MKIAIDKILTIGLSVAGGFFGGYVVGTQKMKKKVDLMQNQLDGYAVDTTRLMRLNEGLEKRLMRLEIQAGEVKFIPEVETEKTDYMSGYKKVFPQKPDLEVLDVEMDDPEDGDDEIYEDEERNVFDEYGHGDLEGEHDVQIMEVEEWINEYFESRDSGEDADQYKMILEDQFNYLQLNYDFEFDNYTYYIDDGIFYSDETGLVCDRDTIEEFISEQMVDFIRNLEYDENACFMMVANAEYGVVFGVTVMEGTNYPDDPVTFYSDNDTVEMSPSEKLERWKKDAETDEDETDE